MALPSNPLDLSGNSARVDHIGIAYDSQANAALTATTRPHICAGSGAPTFTANKGTVYIRIDGSSTSTRLYVNTDGATTWTNVTTAA